MMASTCIETFIGIQNTCNVFPQLLIVFQCFSRSELSFSLSLADDMSEGTSFIDDAIIAASSPLIDVLQFQIVGRHGACKS